VRRSCAIWSRLRWPTSVPCDRPPKEATSLAPIRREVERYRPYTEAGSASAPSASINGVSPSQRRLRAKDAVGMITLCGPNEV